MKNTTIITIAAALIGASGAMAQTTVTAFSPPVGFVTVDIDSAPSEGTATTTAFSVNLQSSKDFSGAATAVSGQTVTVAGQSWAANNAEWAASGQPHLLYIANANGEKVFLITGNTADTLTVDTDANLSDSFANDASVCIVNAPTVGSLFGETSSEVTFLQASSSAQADNVFLSQGSGFALYWHNGSFWTTNGLSNNSDDVVFPDEGIFVTRRSTDDLSIVFTGAIPTDSQLTAIPSGASFVGSRFPVDTAIEDMGFLQLPGWVSAASFSNADQVFIWLNGSWQRYWHTGSFWTNNGLSNNNTDVVPGSSALFVLKNSAGDGVATATIPYDLNN